MTGISRNDELLPLNAPKSHDELGILWREFNQMVLRLKDDMKERLRVEQQLRNSEARLTAILATAPDGIITLDERGILKSANAAACAMFRITSYNVCYTKLLRHCSLGRKTSLHRRSGLEVPGYA